MIDLLTGLFSSGGKPPPVIVIPPPVGFVPPPAGVPSVKDPKQCPEDYSTTDCSDCKPLEGWCTVGPQAGCPCREECPTDDDKKPKCGDVACQGEETGTCTVVSDCFLACMLVAPSYSALLISTGTLSGL